MVGRSVVVVVFVVIVVIVVVVVVDNVVVVRLMVVCMSVGTLSYAQALSAYLSFVFPVLEIGVLHVCPSLTLSVSVGLFL